MCYTLSGGYMLIDTHCHISMSDIDSINNMDGIMITAGCDDETNKEVIELVKKYPNVYGVLGIHPEEIDKITDSSFKFIEDNLSNKKIVGIGEIGLDYYWRSDNKEKQKEVFERQLELAEKYNLPVVIHSRDAIQDTYDIVSKYKLRGSIHCFSSSLEMAKEFVKLGYKIGVGGTITFKNSKKLQEIVQVIDIENILLETDSPYLSPEPFRGRKNEPKNVYYVAKKIAEIKGEKVDKIIGETYASALEIFDILR